MKTFDPNGKHITIAFRLTPKEARDLHKKAAPDSPGQLARELVIAHLYKGKAKV